MPGRYYPSNQHPRYGGGGSQRSGGPPGGGGPAADSHPAAGGTANPSNNPPPSLSPESLALARLRQKSISHPLQTCQLTIYVPPHTVGAVIGRGGRTILNVQREAMRRSAGHVAPVRISVLGGGSGGGAPSTAANGPPSSHQQEGVADGQGESFPPSSQGASGTSTWDYHGYVNQQKQQQNQQQSDDNTDDSDIEEEEWTPVIIRGDPVGIFAAVRQILPLVDRDHDPDIVLEVPIHRAKHNMLVGKGGIIIAALSATYETRIMIPPNEFMSNVTSPAGTENFWKQRQQAQNDVGSAMLFGDPAGQSQNPSSTGGQPGASGTLPPNVIQLEGDIDKVELCLVKMLSIVSGERWVPTGVIVQQKEENNGRAKSAPKASSDGPPATATTSGKGKDETTAEAVIVKIWTPSSKLLNLGKIRKVQRKTNTVIRRKKLRFSGNIIDGSGAPALVNEKEEDVEEDLGEPSLVNEENEEEDGAKEVSASGPKTATKYIITGKTESVKSAAAQFEKILGLEPGTSAITDTTNNANLTDGGGGGNNKDTGAQAGSKTDPDSDAGGGGPGGKKVRRKKKRGKGGNAPRTSKDGPPQSQDADS